MSLKLYLKAWCGWCVTAKQVLDARGYKYEEIDVDRNPAEYREMIRLSGQTLTPTLVADGKVLPDFGPDELVEFLNQNNITP